MSETGREGPGKLQLSPGHAAASPHGRGTCLVVVSVIFPGDNSMQDGCPHCDCLYLPQALYVAKRLAEPILKGACPCALVY